jgi:hypothetical protein
MQSTFAGVPSSCVHDDVSHGPSDDLRHSACAMDTSDSPVRMAHPDVVKRR